MTRKIYPGVACRLEFFAEDSDGLPVPSLTHSDVSAAAYCNRQDGVLSSATSVSLTSSVAATAAVSAGQFVTINSARGHYAIDAPSGAAGAALDYAEASVTFSGGHTVTAVRHEIDLNLQYATSNVSTLSALSGRIPAALVSGRMDCSVGVMASNVITAAAIAADAGAELAALVEAYIVNEGDATAVLQAVADKIAADWVAGDASPLAIAAAVWSAGSRTITGGSLTTAPPTAAAIADAVWDEAGNWTGGDSWTEEQVTYALEKLALLGVVADAVVVPAGTFLCGRGDIEQIFGTTAVAKWGDLNNNEDADEITGRINYRIAIADSFMRSTLGNSAWVLPVEGDAIPPILAYYTACLAGVLLYEGRGVQDYDARGNAQHQLSFHKKGVDDFVKGVLFGSVSLAPLEYNVASAAPEAT